LKSDADDHLSERGARDGVSATKRLRAEQHVDAEGAALPNDPIHEQRSGLRNLIVLDEEFLNSSMSRSDLGRGFVAAGPFVAGYILHSEFAEQSPRRLSSSSSFCKTLNPNSRSLSMATTRACGNRCVA